MTIEIKTSRLTGGGVIANNYNPRRRVYLQALNLTGRDPATVCEDRFHTHRENG